MAGLLLIIIIIYFVPTIVAASRNRAVGVVFALNFFLGWTLVAWVIALAWALSEQTARERGADVIDPRLLALTLPKQEDSRACPECAELIKLAATKCRFCGAVVTPV